MVWYQHIHVADSSPFTGYSIEILKLTLRFKLSWMDCARDKWRVEGSLTTSSGSLALDAVVICLPGKEVEQKQFWG